MSYKRTVLGVCLLLIGIPAFAQLQKACPVPDVVPTENITSIELNPSQEVVDHSANTSVSKMTFKTYYAFNRNFSLGAELPLARYESPAKSKNGLGDVQFSASWSSAYNENWSFGSSVETLLPTATGKELGSGKVQVNPSVYAVYMPTGNFFFSCGYKQSWSVAGDGGRNNINNGRIRSVVAYLSDAQWWALVDPRYIINYDTIGEAKFETEAEIGTQINQGASVYLRGGGKLAGNMAGSDWTISVGFRILYL